MKVFHYDNHFGDLWGLLIDDAAEKAEAAIRVAEGDEIEGFPSISTGFVDAAVALEHLAVLSDSDAFLVEVNTDLDLDDWNRRMNAIASKDEDRHSIEQLFEILRGNFTRIRAQKA